MASSDEESLLHESVKSMSLRGTSGSSAASLLGDVESCANCALSEVEVGDSASCRSCSISDGEGDSLCGSSASDDQSDDRCRGGISPHAPRSYASWGYGEQSGGAPWSEAIVAPLDLAQRRTLQQNASVLDAPFLVGSDCSGCDAVWEALGHLTDRWKSALGYQYRFHKEFCSEHPGREGDAPRHFLHLNSRPRIMFSDLCSRGRTGWCSYREGRVATPEVHLYSAGWVCKDDSAANTISRKLVTVSLTDASGDSTRTLHGSIKYIAEKRPAVAILENTLRKNNIEVAVTLLHGVPRYGVAVFKANSTSFFTAASRPRIYIVAVNLDKVTITTPIRRWSECLTAMSSEMPIAAVQDFLLQDQHSHVQEFLRELQTSSTDRDWRRCKKMHQRVRKAFLRKYGTPIPDVDELRRVTLGKFGKNLSVLTPRQLDAYGLHISAAKIALGTALEDYDMVVDVTNNVSMASCKHTGHSGSMSCLLRTHQYVHTMRGRPICGIERMRVQGYSRDLVLRGKDSGGNPVQVSQRSLCALAGDTMSVPVMGALLAVVFSCCLVEPPPSPVTVSEAEFGSSNAGVWVGHRLRPSHGCSTEVDKLPMDCSSESEQGTSSDCDSLL